MAWTHMMTGAGVLLTGVFSTGFVYGGMKAIAAENGAPGTENCKLACAPQFDGLDCFETIVSTEKHPKSVDQPKAPEKSVTKNRSLAPAPQFDGLHCFETFVYNK